MSAQTVVPPSSGGLLFDAALTSRQDLGAYPYQINTGLSPITGRPRALLMDDPVHGSARTVLRMASDQSADHDGHPSLRVQCETETFIRSARHGHIGDIYYAGFALFLPDEFRDLAETDWLTIGAGAYGSPYGGSGPLSLGLRPTADVGGEHRLVLADRPELLGEVVVPRGRWIDIVMGFRLAYAENGGWLSVWMNTGEGWGNLAVLGEDRASYDALSEGVNDAWHRDENRSPNSSRIGVYGNQPNTLLHGWHRIGHTFSDAMPNSHPGSPLPEKVQ
ncbi:hypothetical protein [Kocuria rosea]|uniref:Uncharacterized protein n=1 Tax=Kocuria rosea subsp. polaris TaxID=136273 RepID=A0A0A6YCJ1_KOCRO|nr:hypothetical protein [Kocuria polaris]KHD97527.1 hypothetical protein GY22_09350 [Kocuria polaris]